MRRLLWAALLLGALQLTQPTLFEDGSWRVGAISGCLPDALCADDYTDDCPPGLEDVECWEATR